MRTTRCFLFMSLFGLSVGLTFPETSRAADEASSISTEDAAEADALRKKGLALFNKKEYAQAVEAFQKSLVLERKFGAMAQMASALNALRGIALVRNGAVRIPESFGEIAPRGR